MWSVNLKLRTQGKQQNLKHILQNSLLVMRVERVEIPEEHVRFW